jgi:hypothetical protein
MSEWNHDRMSVACNRTKKSALQVHNVPYIEKSCVKREFSWRFLHKERFLANCNLFSTSFCPNYNDRFSSQAVYSCHYLKVLLNHTLPLPCFGEESLHSKIWELYIWTENLYDHEAEVLRAHVQSLSNSRPKNYWPSVVSTRGCVSMRYMITTSNSLGNISIV